MSRPLSVRFGLLLILGCSICCDVASSAPVPESYRVTRDKGWAEVILRTRDSKPILRFATEVAGWQLHGPYCGEGSCQWWITDLTRGVGSLRIIEDGRLPIPVAPSMLGPPSAGGIFSVMTRSNALREAYYRALERGWRALSEPVEISFGPVQLLNVIVYHPEGGVVSIYERLSPRMPNDADLNQLRRPFNSMQIVQSIEKAKKFYVDELGFSVIAEGRFVGDPTGSNNFSLPAGSSLSRALDYLIVAPSAEAATHIEIVRFVMPPGRASHGATSEVSTVMTDDDRSSRFDVLRFPVNSLNTWRQKLQDSGVEYSQFFGRVFPPFEPVDSLEVTSPEGAVIEFFELPD